VKTALLILLLSCTFLPAGEPEQRAQFVTQIYDPELIYRMNRSIHFGENPLKEAATKDQRRFVRAYLAVKDEDSRRPKEAQKWHDITFPWMEALRRCGIDFPEGTTVRWLYTFPPLLVTHTPETIKRIEKLMDLKLKR